MTDREREKEEEEAGKKGFTVRDRRRFTETGESRESEQASRREESESREEPKPAARENPPITFSVFLVSLSTQALVCLGEVSSPEDGTVRKDLDAARELIDIIAMLKDKTQGNVDPDEEKLIENILYDLRMRFVRTARS